MTDTPIIDLPVHAAPKQYMVAGAQEIILKGVTASFDGTLAAGDFVPAVQILDPGGHVVGTYTLGSTLAAGASADISWFPGVNPPASAVSALETTDGSVDVNPTTELFIGTGITLTNPAAGEARLDVHATGAELAYDQITANVTITGTSGAQQLIFTLGPVTYDGATRVRVETYTPTFDIEASGGGGGNLIAELWIDSTDLGRMGQANVGGVGAFADNGWPMNTIEFVTPSAGSHTFYIKYWSTGGTPTITADAGGALAYMPAWARISVA